MKLQSNKCMMADTCVSDTGKQSKQVHATPDTHNRVGRELGKTWNGKLVVGSMGWQGRLADGVARQTIWIGKA